MIIDYCINGAPICDSTAVSVVIRGNAIFFVPIEFDLQPYLPPLVEPAMQPDAPCNGPPHLKEPWKRRKP